MSGLNEALREQPRRMDLALPRLLGDERLARLAAAGDERAFAAIYRRYGGELHRYCHAILGSSEDAADALQNTMVSALRALPGERREIALKPWLFRVAHNEAISLLRQRRPGAELDPEQLTAPGADAVAATAERLRRLVRDLGQLPDRQRAALVMRELNGISCEEIGASLGCTASAARQLIYEARIALQEIAEGRKMNCELIRRAISERDGRMLRARRLRAHLRECEACADFKAGILERREDLAQLAPVLSLPAVLGLLKSAALGGGGAGGAGATSAGAALSGSAAVKSATAVFAAAAIGAGAAQVSGVVDLPGLGDREAGGERSGSSAPAEGVGPGPPAGGARGSASGQDPGVRAGTPQRGVAPAGKAGGQSRPSKTPPGQANTPPGQGDAPPGQVKTRPGRGTMPPGQAAPPPGQSLTPPGQVKTPPGQSGPPPGQAQTPPGQTTTPPGQTTTPPGEVEPRPQAPATAPASAAQAPGGGGAASGATWRRPGPSSISRP
jgi:RNA polymerase sigma factor (sigma-70 family)